MTYLEGKLDREHSMSLQKADIVGLEYPEARLYGSENLCMRMKAELPE